MTALILDGKQVATALKNKIAATISEDTNSGQMPPGLAVILVGNDSASEIYVNNKRKACLEVGISSYAFDLPKTTSQEKLVNLITELNHREDIHGILVQLPLPAAIDSNKIIECISPSKDVDGFHPYNLGRLAQRNPLLRPCTPYGIIQLLNAYNLPLRGKHAVVVGASNIVGRPMALEFLLAGATVTICHRFTKNLEQLIRMAEVVVVAAGVCDVIDPEWLNQSQILIDVGMHRLENGTLRGDVNFDKASTRTGWITPVPGGVGPMTIATLLLNTLTACHEKHKAL
ncbi:MAG: bifunctional methylenetetrahydrofolate dehydrogenase/methenyltetrahydrofolate cyclohydrolase FolD [Legionella sp.]|nr:bifunctional methylenetetrahydrofolate dehydrogenase/methenyltetrahydrofolate cyclohydrolase FolD [Legionella sp.]